ncbi:MAG: hypothetical protein ACREMG_06990, partial [Gemmatimonadales bacterium]
MGFWWAQHYFQRIAWRHMTPPGHAAEREPALRKRLGRYRAEHFDPVGWQAHRMAQLCFWAAPLWWLGLGLVLAVKISPPKTRPTTPITVLLVVAIWAMFR